MWLFLTFVIRKGRYCVMASLFYYDQNQEPIFVFPVMFIFGNPSRGLITKALIYTKRQNPEGC